MGLYTTQVVQTDRKTPSIAHLRDGLNSVTFWPRVQTLALMPSGNEIYRRTTLAYTVPKKVLANGVDTLAGLGIFDLTAKFNIAMSQTEIDAAYAEFLKLLNLADVKKAICEQVRITGNLTTP